MSTATAKRDEADPPVANPAEGETLIKHLLDVMEALLGTVEEETALVQAGRSGQARSGEGRTVRPVCRRYHQDPGEPGLSQPCHAEDGRGAAQSP